MKHAQEIATNRQSELDEIQRKLENADIEKEQLVSNKDEVIFMLFHITDNISNIRLLLLRVFGKI